MSSNGIRFIAARTFSTMASNTPPRVALVLSGSGVYDGTELTEGASALIHLSRKNASVSAFAPDKPQMHVINHLTGEEVEAAERNCLAEAARLARGNVKALEECDAENFDALVVPGGFGAAKNLSDFAVNGDKLTVDPQMERIVNQFVAQKKVIGMCCIAPVIAAKLIPGVRLTMGMDAEGDEDDWPYAGACGAAKAMGATHMNKRFDEACVDEDKLVVTSAAYMYNGKPHEIDDSVGAMVDGVIDLVGKTQK